MYDCILLWEDIHTLKDREHPTYQCTLFHVLVGSSLIHLNERFELINIKLVHGTKTDSTNDNLLICRYYGWRKQ